MKNTTENNKLIAEFMGNNEIRVNIPFSFEIGETIYATDKLCESESDCIDAVIEEINTGIFQPCSMNVFVPNYHNSWDWLMRVVEKIGYKAYVSIETRGTRINLKDEIIADIVGRGHKPTMIDNTYQAVVLFIKWYNKNK